MSLNITPKNIGFPTFISDSPRSTEKAEPQRGKIGMSFFVYRKSQFIIHKLYYHRK
jgi:hypothetical protein